MRNKKVHFAVGDHLSEGKKSKQKCCRFISIDEGFPLIIVLALVDLVYTLLLGIHLIKAEPEVKLDKDKCLIGNCQWKETMWGDLMFVILGVMTTLNLMVYLTNFVRYT
jgi:hypothetical protein